MVSRWRDKGGIEAILSEPFHCTGRDRRMTKVNFWLGAVIRGNASAEHQRMIRDRGNGRIVKLHPKQELVTVHWENNKREKWHIELLELVAV
jgi:hypothetical protein